MKLLLLIFLLAATTAFSQTNGWRQLGGPYGGGFTQVVVGKDSNIFGILIDGSIYHRNSLGWEKLQSPLDIEVGVYMALTLDKEGNIFCYNTIDGTTTKPGIYKSTDYGKNWSNSLGIRSIQRIISAKSGKLYAFQGGPNNSTTVIYASTNHGDSWDVLTSIPLRSVEFFVDNNDRCYFSTNSNTLEVIRYDRNTDQFEDLTSTFASVGKVYLSEFHDTILAKTTDAIYYLNASNTWKKQGQFNFPKAEPYTWRSNYPLFTSTISNKLYTTGQIGNTYEIFSSSNLGKTWLQFISNTPDMGYGINFMTVDDNAIAYIAGVNMPRGIWGSADLGATWKQIGSSYDIPFFQEGPNKSLFVKRTSSATGLIDAMISLSDDSKWDKLPSVFSNISDNENGVFAKDFNGGFLFFSTQGIYYCSPPDFTELKLQDSLTLGMPVIRSAVTKKNCIVQAAYGSFPNFYPIYSSSNHGISWENISFPNNTVGYMAMNADNDGTVFIGSYESLYKSADECRTWTKVETGITKAIITAITFDNDRIFLGTIGSGVWQSVDHGMTWSRWLMVPGDSVVDLVAYHNKCYCASTSGVYVCAFDSTMWQPALFVNQYFRINQLIKTSEGKLYASIKDRGLWAFDESIRSISEKEVTGTALRIVSQSPQSITVAFDASGEQRELSLYNILGNRVWYMKVVSSNDAQPLVIPTTSLVEGLYYIMLKSSKENESAKVLIHH